MNDQINTVHIHSFEHGERTSSMYEVSVLIADRSWRGTEGGLCRLSVAQKGIKVLVKWSIDRCT